MSAPRDITPAEREEISRRVDRAWFLAFFRLYERARLRNDFVGCSRRIHGRGLTGRAAIESIAWDQWCGSTFRDMFVEHGSFLTLEEFLGDQPSGKEASYGMVFRFQEAERREDQPLDLKATEPWRRMLFRIRVGRIAPGSDAVWAMARHYDDEPEFLRQLANVKQALKDKPDLKRSIVFGAEALSPLQRLLLTRWDFTPDEIPPLVYLTPAQRAQVCRRVLNLSQASEYQVDQARKKLELRGLHAGKLKIQFKANGVQVQPYKRFLNHPSQGRTKPGNLTVFRRA